MNEDNVLTMGETHDKPFTRDHSVDAIIHAMIMAEPLITKRSGLSSAPPGAPVLSCAR
jgi:hypothetical protein